MVSGIAVAFWLLAALPRLLEPELERWLSRRLSSTVTVDSLAVGWLPPTVTASGVRILAEGESDPVLIADRVRVEARWLEAVRVPRRLRAVRIERPQVHLTIDGEGKTNLPKIATGGRGSGVTIDALEIVGGTATVAERRIPLDLAARQVKLHASGSTTELIVGSVEAADVVAELPTGATYGGALALRAAWADRRLELRRGRVSGPDFQAAIEDGFFDLPTRQWRVGLTATGNANWLDRLGLDPGELRTDWRFSGAVEGGDGWRVAGDLTAARVDWPPIVFRQLESGLVIDSETLSLNDLRARFAGGALRGRAEVDLSEPAHSGTLRYRVDGGDVQALADQLGLELPNLRGRWEIDGNYEFEAAEARLGSGRASAVVELSDLDATLDWRRRIQISIRRGELEFGTRNEGSAGESLAFQGTYSLPNERGAIDYKLATDKVEGWLDLLLAPTDELSAWLPRGGRSAVSGVLNLSGELWSSRLEADIFEGRVGELEVGHLGGALTVSAAGVRDLRLDLTRPRGAMGVSGGLQGGAAGEATSLDLRVAVDGWPARELLAQLGLEINVDGDVIGIANLTGTTEEARGTIELELDSGEVESIPFEAMTARMALDAGRLTVEEAAAIVAGGSLSGSGWVALDGSEADFAAQVEKLDLESSAFDELLPSELAGHLRGGVRWRGDSERPDLELSLLSDDLGFGGLAVSPDEPGRLTASLIDGQVRLDAELGRFLDIGGGGTVDGPSSQIVLALSSDSVGKLLSTFSFFDEATVQGALAGELRLAGDLLAGEIELTVSLPRLDLSYGERRLGLLEPIEMTWRDGGLDIRSFFLGQSGTGNEIFVTGRLPVTTLEPLDLDVQVSVDTSWLQLVLPDWSISGGTVDALASVGGTLSEPLINGQGELRQERVRVPGVPQAVEQARAIFLFYPGEVVVDEGEFRFAGGFVKIAGNMKLYGEEGLQYRMQVAVKRIQLRFPEGWLVRGDAELTVTSEPGGRQIRGQVDIERAQYSADVPIGLLQLLQRAFSRRPLLVEESDELLASTHLNIAVNGDSAMRIRNNVADLRGSIDLIARGNLARPVVFGDVKVESGGTLVYSGNEYLVQRAELNFVNPYRLQPVVDLEATTRLQEYDVSLTLAGTLERLDVAFSSNPPLPDLDVLSLMTGGETRTGASEFGRDEQGDFAAQAFLYGQAASAVASRVNRLFGLDKFRIDPLTGESGSLTSARVTVGKRLSSDVFATYSYDPSQNLQQILQIEWQVSRLLTLVATQNGDDTYAVDARWERSF